MNLTRLFEVQLVLDGGIEGNHPTEKLDRIEKKFLAFYTEVAECANEWRGFKFWSANQQPKRCIKTTEGANEHNAVEYFCGNCEEKFKPDDKTLVDLFGNITDECPECSEGSLYAFRHKNPLLEEYVDGIHFLLSLGLEFGFEKIDFPEEAKQYEEIGTRFKEKNITRQFNGLYRTAAEFESNHHEFDYIELFLAYLALGEMLEFTWDQVEKAYFSKNQINHQRQQQGY